MKYVIVTGATGGIGFSTANRLLEEGYGVWAVGRDERKIAEKFEGRNNLKIISCDYDNEKSIAETIKFIVNSTGPVDGFVHCAGFDKLSPVYLNKRKDIEALMSIHVYAAMDFCKMLAKKGNANEGCSIVLISSLAAHEGARGHSAYAAAKGALEGFLMPAASELSEKKIRINEIVLGAIQTEMTKGYVSKMDESRKNAFKESYPLGVGIPEDVTGAISFLIGENSSWITGQKITIDGGHFIRKV